jgi:hypothetical protein
MRKRRRKNEKKMDKVRCNKAEDKIKAKKYIVRKGKKYRGRNICMKSFTHNYQGSTFSH